MAKYYMLYVHSFDLINVIYLQHRSTDFRRLEKYRLEQQALLHKRNCTWSVTQVL